MKVARNTWSRRLVGAILASIIAVLAGPPVFAYPIPGPESAPYTLGGQDPTAYFGLITVWKLGMGL